MKTQMKGLFLLSTTLMSQDLIIALKKEGNHGVNTIVNLDIPSKLIGFFMASLQIGNAMKVEVMQLLEMDNQH